MLLQKARRILQSRRALLLEASRLFVGTLTCALRRFALTSKHRFA